MRGAGAGRLGLRLSVSPVAADDVHVLHDLVALIQPGPVASGLPPGEGDSRDDPSRERSTDPHQRVAGGSSRNRGRPCGCPLERLGWAGHLRTIRSYEKMTTGGMAFLDVDVIPCPRGNPSRALRTAGRRRLPASRGEAATQPARHAARPAERPGLRNRSMSRRRFLEAIEAGAPPRTGSCRSSGAALAGSGFERRTPWSRRPLGRGPAPPPSRRPSAAGPPGQPLSPSYPEIRRADRRKATPPALSSITTRRPG